MFCECYRQPLTDAACSGEALPHELAAHLDVCDACSFAFAAEQALLASIDRSLHAAVNPDVPPWLVPRVLTQLESIPAKTFWRLPAIACATGGLALVVIGFVYSSIRRSAVDSSRTNAIVVTPTNQSAAANQQEESPPHVSQPYAALGPREQTLVRREKFRSDPEVLVSAEEQAEFVRSIARLQARPLEKSIPAAAKAGLDAEIEPLEIAELELGQLAIEPLEDLGSE